MQTSIKELSPTARSLQVTVPQDQFAEQVDQRLKRLARTIRMDGFRPGKVPPRIVRQRHLGEVYEDVIQTMAKQSLTEALQQSKMQPVVDPQLTVDSFGEDQPLKYTARFDIYPTLERSRLDTLNLIEPQIEVADEDVTQGMEQLREKHKRWDSVEREVKDGDQVVLDYQMSELNTPPLEIAPGGPELIVDMGDPAHLLPLQEQLRGLRAGEEKLTPIEFPAEPALAALAGKHLNARLRIREVRQAHLPAWTDEDFLLAICGEGGSREKIETQVRAHLTLKCRELCRAYSRRQLIVALTATKGESLPVPESLRDWCLSVLAREHGVEQPDKLAADHPIRQQADHDARLATVFQVLCRLYDGQLGKPDLKQVTEEYASQFLDRPAARERATQDPKVYEYLSREAIWEQLIQKVGTHARVSLESLSMTEAYARLQETFNSDA